MIVRAVPLADALARGWPVPHRAAVVVLEAGADDADAPHAVRLAASIDPTGDWPTEPDCAAVAIFAPAHPERTADLAASAPVLAALLDAIREAVARLGRPAIVLPWDPFDAAGLRVLESHGLVPTGRQPYFIRPGGLVEYVMGYADATGALVDLGWPT